MMKRFAGLWIALGLAFAALSPPYRAQESSGGQVSPYKQELIEKEKEYEVLIERLRAEAPRYASLQYPQPMSPEEVARVVLTDPRAGLVQFMMGEKVAVAFVLRPPDGKRAGPPGPRLSVVQLDREAINKAARAFHASVSDPGSTDCQARGRALHGAAFAPLEPLLKGVRHLYVIPDGLLFYVPFEAITDTRGRYLIDRFRISYAPSSSVLVEVLETQRARPAASAGGAPRRFLGVGDPVFAADKGPATAESAGADAGPGAAAPSRPAFERLPYTGVEVEQIAALFPASDVLLGDDAREETLKERDLTAYRVLHFATHGVVDENAPAQSGVVLSLAPRAGQASTEDGFLQMSEIFNLRLDADLVTLSACQTGLGKNVRGEGMVGIQRAFLYAGTPSVLVSLWDVNDLTTAWLMRAFYANLQKGLNKADALRAARRAMVSGEIDIAALETQLPARQAGAAPPPRRVPPHRVDASHPYYWAPFVLVGSPE